MNGSDVGLREPLLTAANIDTARQTEGRAAGLFLTDRCPVGCSHCSVDSRKDSPTIQDFAKFAQMVETLANRNGLQLVAITGGEPFVERRAISYAIECLDRHRKQIVVFTSGVWASNTVPRWILSQLQKVNTVFLSTDAFHNERLTDQAFVRAARAVADSGCWIIVQVLGFEDMNANAHRLLECAFGNDYALYSEVVSSRPLPYGRGAAHFRFDRLHNAETFGACRLLSSPLIRYDGQVLACCNEQVVTGQGPSRLRRHCKTSQEANSALDEFELDPLFSAMRRVGVGPLVYHPKFTSLKNKRFKSICDLCWEIQDLAAHGEISDDAILTALVDSRN
ncbi:radical SAM protein [Paraburkholderia sp. RP-4-7]|uniref:Radical SAM protein n=1 Tax=Paraburkholderia polaris TaxID=2728848 RepID=A0A848IM17_9BURK|nr:radical SAM protein [Paraburkholderia polaris]NMM00337.1 radical SAM protein [Paraburkholderia polaris]